MNQINNTIRSGIHSSNNTTNNETIEVNDVVRYSKRRNNEISLQQQQYRTITTTHDWMDTIRIKQPFGHYHRRRSSSSSSSSSNYYYYYYYDKSYMDHIFTILLGCTAFIDFCAAMAKRHHHHYYHHSYPKQQQQHHSYHHQLQRTNTRWDTVFDIMIHSLCYYSNIIGMIFSLIWFLDAFISAHRNSIILRNTHIQRYNNNTNSHDDNNDNDNTIQQQQSTKIQQQSTKVQQQWWYGYHGEYIRSLAIQILFLPVGFFITFYMGILYVLRYITTIITIIQNNNNNNNNNSSNYNDFSITIQHKTPGISDEIEVFTSTSSISLGFALIKHITISIARRTNHMVQLQTATKMKQLVYTLILRGLRHPFRFNQRMKLFLRIVRWIQYIGPLFGVATKLMGNMETVLLKIKQRRIAAIASKVRQKRRTTMTQQQLQEYYVIMIQRIFRAHATRRRLYVLRMIRGEQELIAAIKLQDAFRRSLVRARKTLQEKLHTLQQLQAKERQSLQRTNSVVPMSAIDRRRMYQLQEELESEAKLLINQRLLLRPNTIFAVTWKILFVFAVLFEISTVALQPILSQYKDPDTGNVLELEVIMDKKFIPIPVLQRPECLDTIPLNLKWSHPIHTIHQLTNAIRRMVRPKTNIVQRPWYCSGSYHQYQAIYIYFANLAIHHFLVLVSIIMFVDVYIEFFTGRYDPNTGQLVPPPFFERYIFPGLFLQLLVNPEMDTVAYLLSKAIVGLIHHDPIRILRWIVAFFYPLFLFTKDRIQELWIKYVKDQNQYCIQYMLKPF